MSQSSQPREILRRNGAAPHPLRFALKLRLHLQMSRLTVAQGAEKSGVSNSRMEDLCAGAHCPLAADVLRVSYGLGIAFEPEDFEERGLSL